MHSRLGSMTLSQLAFPGESNLHFPWEKSHWDNTVVWGKKKEAFTDLSVLRFVSVPVLPLGPHPTVAHDQKKKSHVPLSRREGLMATEMETHRQCSTQSRGTEDCTQCCPEANKSYVLWNKMLPQNLSFPWCRDIVNCRNAKTFSLKVLAGSPSHGGDVKVRVFWHKPTQLAHSFFFYSALGIYFCFYHPFNCSSFLKFSFSPDIIPSGWLDSKHKRTSSVNFSEIAKVSENSEAAFRWTSSEPGSHPSEVTEYWWGPSGLQWGHNHQSPQERWTWQLSKLPSCPLDRCPLQGHGTFHMRRKLMDHLESSGSMSIDSKFWWRQGLIDPRFDGSKVRWILGSTHPRTLTKPNPNYNLTITVTHRSLEPLTLESIDPWIHLHLDLFTLGSIKLICFGLCGSISP